MAKKTDVKTPKEKPAKAAQATHATYAANPDKLPPKSARAGDEDPAVANFTDGLKAMDRKDWAKAVELFGKAIEVSDLADLTARARQYQAAAQKLLTPPRADDEDPYLQAIVEKNRGNLKAAL